jgi:hypothetical protein
MNNMTSCLGIVLGLYGYAAEDQQAHFVNLLELSGTDIPSAYTAPHCASQDEYAALDWLIKVTQEKFYARATGERWEQKIPSWIIKEPDKIISEAKALGVIDRTSPTKPDFECAAIYGSTAPEMRKRIEDFKSRVEEGSLNTQKVFLLTGERYATASVDGGEGYIKKLAQNNTVSEDKVTETMIMEDIYETQALGAKKLIKDPITIDTPRGKKARPNTIDTIEAFLKAIKKDECASIVFISRAPYKIAQEEDTKKIMYLQSPWRKFEVIGGAAQITEVNHGDSAAYHMLMAIAGGLYGGFEMVSRELNSKYDMCTSIEYLTKYKTTTFSKTHAITSNKNVEVHSKSSN